LYQFLVVPAILPIMLPALGAEMLLGMPAVVAEMLLRKGAL
jgi:hypothetical protein